MRDLVPLLGCQFTTGARAALHDGVLDDVLIAQILAVLTDQRHQLVVLEVGVLLALVGLREDEDALRDPGVLPGSREDVPGHHIVQLDVGADDAALIVQLCVGQVGHIGHGAAGGFALGVLFLMGLDKAMPYFLPEPEREEGVRRGLKRSGMLIFAITLHNIPEGMAVGLAFALAAHNDSSVLLASAIALAIGMGIQNFPEGAAIALPLRQSGMSRAKAFGLGTLSGIVEPVFGLLTVLAAGAIQPLLPWLLAFAAGAMLYVVVEELIPEAHLGEGHMGTVGVMLGFLLMMILDVALG